MHKEAFELEGRQNVADFQGRLTSREAAVNTKRRVKRA
jgi:hypothetical protein